MTFEERRRQQFMGEANYRAELALWDEVLAGQRENLTKPEGGERGWHLSMHQGIAEGLLNQFLLHYTAGELIEPLRGELEEIVAAYERYGEYLWKYTGDRNEPVFGFVVMDEYCQLMQLIGLCFLLHRRDLLPRLAALQDGLDAVGQDGEGNGGTDTLYEEFMAHGLGPESRYESDWLCCTKPYAALFHAMTETSNATRLKELNIFLKHWYKDLAGTGWHDAHITDEDGNQGGYYGYWSFEAGAAVILLGIEDDSSLHKYLYYPKDLVAWSRENAARFSDGGPGDGASRSRPNVPAGQPCPEAGWWFTPAKQDSRRYFKQGETMPDVGSDYGITFWQWSQDQSAPKL